MNYEGSHLEDELHQQPKAKDHTWNGRSLAKLDKSSTSNQLSRLIYLEMRF